MRATWSICLPRRRCVVGETEENHQELVQFCHDFPFQRMGAFTFSEEDGTPAADYGDQVCALPRDKCVMRQTIWGRCGMLWRLCDISAQKCTELDMLKAASAAACCCVCYW